MRSPTFVDKRSERKALRKSACQAGSNDMTSSYRMSKVRKFKFVEHRTSQTKVRRTFELFRTLKLHLIRAIFQVCNSSRNFRTIELDMLKVKAIHYALIYVEHML